MCQHVQDATHIASGCLDLVNTQSPVKVTDPLVSDIGFSGHFLVTCQLLVNLLEVDPITVEGRKWKGFSVKSFKSNLSKSAQCGDLSWTLSASVNELFDRYSYEISKLSIHLAVGSVERSICSYHGSTMDAQISDVLLIDWRRNIGEPGKMMTESNGLQALKSSRFIFTRKQLYWSARIKSNSSSSRKLWQDLDLLMRKSDDSPTPLSSNDRKLLEALCG